MLWSLCRNDSYGVCLSSDSGQTLRLAVRTPDCVQVRRTFSDIPEHPPGILCESAPLCRDWTVEQTGREVILKTEALRVTVNLETGRVQFCARNEIVLKEIEYTLHRRDVVRFLYDPDGPKKVIRTVDGERTEAIPVGETVDRQAVEYKQRFERADHEVLYGLGQHEDGVFNRCRQPLDLFQTNMKSPVPVILSSAGYGLLFNTAAVSRFEADDSAMSFSSDCADALDCFFMAGPSFDRIIATYRALTGRAAMMPRWLFGYVQSKERYQSAQELLDAVQEFRRRGIPLDCIVQDWKYWPNDWWGQKSFDPARYPDPQSLIDALHAENVKLMVSIWPNMRNDGPDQQALSTEGMLLGDGSVYNAFDPEARRRYWRQAYDGLGRYGVDAWWCDSTEPFNLEWGGEEKPAAEERLTMIEQSFCRYLDPADANAYPLVHAEGIFDGQRAVAPERRVVNLTRSGWAGQQRFGCIVWSGDIAARWDVLKAQIAEGLNFCASGLPYWTVDIGAFFTGGHECYKRWADSPDAPPVWFWKGDYDAGADDPAYRELYVRWLQWAAFLPVMRSHGTDTPREPWRFGDEGDLPYDVIADFIRLRYRLLPYLYSLAAKQTLEDYTMMRLLAFDFRDDFQCLEIADQYMLGPALLVCPVTEPGAVSRSVYLPAGCDWFDFWTDRKYSGGKTVVADAPLERIPLFVRAGSILPLGSDVQHSGQEQEITLRIYPGADAEFALYTDSGDGPLAGETVVLRWNNQEQTLECSAECSFKTEVI